MAASDRRRRQRGQGLTEFALVLPVFMDILLGMFDELLNAFVLTDQDADLDALAAQLADFEWNGIRPH